MTETTTAVPPVRSGLFTQPEPDGHPRLLGGYCPECDKYFFPRPAWCRSCLKPVREVDLGADGRLYSFTVVRTKPPLGLPKPYGLGYVDLEVGGLRIFSLLDPAALDRLSLNQRLTLKVDVLGNDNLGRPVMRPFFSPLFQEGG